MDIVHFSLHFHWPGGAGRSTENGDRPSKSAITPMAITPMAMGAPSDQSNYYCMVAGREFFLPDGFAHCEFLAPSCSVCDQLERGQSTTRVLQRHNAPSACSETT